MFIASEALQDHSSFRSGNVTLLKELWASYGDETSDKHFAPPERLKEY